MMNNEFEIVFRDRDDYDHLLVQIRFKDFVICEISKEEGNEHMKVVMLCDGPVDTELDVQFRLDDFLEVLRIAKEEFSRCP